AASGARAPLAPPPTWCGHRRRVDRADHRADRASGRGRRKRSPWRGEPAALYRRRTHRPGVPAPRRSPARPPRGWLPPGPPGCRPRRSRPRPAGRPGPRPGRPIGPPRRVARDPGRRRPSPTRLPPPPAQFPPCLSPQSPEGASRPVDREVRPRRTEREIASVLRGDPRGSRRPGDREIGIIPEDPVVVVRRVEVGALVHHIGVDQGAESVGKARWDPDHAEVLVAEVEGCRPAERGEAAPAAPRPPHGGAPCDSDELALRPRQLVMESAHHPGGRPAVVVLYESGR